MTELEDLELALSELEEHMSPLFTRRRELREQIAALRPPAELPAPRYRTLTQEKLARCPRCGGKLADAPTD